MANPPKPGVSMAKPPKTDLEIHLDFLGECSRISLGDFLLKWLERDCELRKQIAEKVNQAIDVCALVRLVEIVRENPDRVAEILRNHRGLLDLPARSKSER